MEKKLIDFKEDILNNIEILRYNYERSIEANMKDPESALYNKIENIIERTNSANSYRALEKTISVAKTIEMQIDNWLISIGQSTISLSWPSF